MTDPQTNATDWLEQELAQIQAPTGDRLPSLKLESGKITKFIVDFSNPFGVWSDENGTKAIIPVTHKGEKKNLWLNKKNPLYREICEKGKSGQSEFSISTTGSQKDTRYTIVEED